MIPGKWIRRERNMAVLTIYDWGGEREVRVPFRFEICPSCDGRGSTSRHVECDGGGFTSSEWAEQDDDFKEDYLAGRYDRPCDDCHAYPGRVMTPDLDMLSPNDRRDWESQIQEELEYEQAVAMERRYGA